MMQLRAVRSLLIEDIADLRPADIEGSQGVSGAIEKARSRALLVAVVDWLAILALFAFRPDASTFLVLAQSEQGLFTLGILAIATHAGYRLAQRQKLGAVARALDSLPPVGGANEEVS